MHAAGVPDGRLQHGQRRRARSSARSWPAIPTSTWCPSPARPAPASSSPRRRPTRSSAWRRNWAASRPTSSCPTPISRRRCARASRAASATAASPATRRPACWCRRDRHDEALAIAKKAAEAHKVGDPDARRTPMLGPVVSEIQYDKIQRPDRSRHQGRRHAGHRRPRPAGATSTAATMCGRPCSAT